MRAQGGARVKEAQGSGLKFQGPMHSATTYLLGRARLLRAHCRHYECRVRSGAPSLKPPLRGGRRLCSDLGHCVATVGRPIMGQYRSSRCSPAQAPGDWSDGKSSRSILLAAFMASERPLRGAAIVSDRPGAVIRGPSLSGRYAAIAGTRQTAVNWRRRPQAVTCDGLLPDARIDHWEAVDRLPAMQRLMNSPPRDLGSMPRQGLASGRLRYGGDFAQQPTLELLGG